MTKILCIDDTPDAPEIDNRSLKQTLQDIYKNSSYKVIFETQATKGIEIAKKGNNVKLVLLDIIFDGQGAENQGDKVAKRLLEVRPDLKIIVLTRISPSGKNRKKSIKFGWMPNVVHYVVKKELSTFNIQQRFKNLCRAIIEDFDNKQWIIEYAGRGTINLHNSEINTTFGVDVSTDFETALVKCMASPNKPVYLPEATINKLPRIHSRINENVMEKSNWNTWGILSKENCAKGQLKLVVGSVKPFPITNTPENPYITRSEYYEELEKLEEEINIIKEKLALRE